MDEVAVPLNRKQLWAGILVCVGLLLLTVYPIPLLVKLFNPSKLVFYWASRTSFWVCLAILFLYAAKIEKKPVLLWRETTQSPEFYIVSFAAIIIVVFFSSVIVSLLLRLAHLSSVSKRFLQLIDLFRSNKLLMVFTCVTAGVVEEFFCRGYLMPRLQLLFNKGYITIIISTLIFALLHAGYGTINQLLGPFVIGLIFALHYYRFRNIRIIMFCHFFWDLQALLISLWAYKGK